MKSRTLVIGILTSCVTFLIQGCSRHCYPTELQLAAEMETKSCQDLGWTYWAKEKKNLRSVVCTTGDGDTFYQFEVTEKGFCEVGYLRETM